MLCARPFGDRLKLYLRNLRAQRHLATGAGKPPLRVFPQRAQPGVAVPQPVLYSGALLRLHRVLPSLGKWTVVRPVGGHEQGVSGLCFSA